MPELWDLLDENRKPLHRTYPRGPALPKGTYHLCVDVWTINSRGEILLTLRHPQKHMFPNKWENTGGSVLAGETSRQGAVRELQEETGIVTAEDALHYLGTAQDRSAFFDCYLVQQDAAIVDLTMQEGETVAARWVTLPELELLLHDGGIAESIWPRLVPFWPEFLQYVQATTTP